MEIVELSANIRTRKRKGIKALRREGLLPAVVYGALPEPLAVQLDTHSTTQILRRLHGTTLIDLKVAGRTHKSLVREVQRDVIRGHLMHIDFLAVAMDKPIRLQVAVELTGIAPVLQLGGVTVMHGLSEIEIECLPGDLVSNIMVDLASLVAAGDSIHVRDITAPKGITILSSQDEMLARASFVEQEKEEAPKAAEPAADKAPEKAKEPAAKK
ncbi:MAG: 50S ribosomal protein L25 [Chloroflexi bacterium]|jgi:large subunit ribosomal protein L25|nr:MAG: 50S ribosomal protein L25 [Chloroflexota bacterium]RLT54123.1 MAG: 50S ribosomal protein L25 [Chloroflexota bacterium]